MQNYSCKLIAINITFKYTELFEKSFDESRNNAEVSLLDILKLFLENMLLDGQINDAINIHIRYY